MQKNKKKTLIFILFVIFLLLLIPLSYAFFDGSANGNELANTTVISSGTMSLRLDDGNQVSGDNWIPGSSLEKNFTIVNTGNLPSTYTVYLTDLINNFVQPNELLYEISSTSPGAYNSSNDMQVPIKSKKLMENIPINPGDSHVYTLTIKFIETQSNQDYNKGKTFSGKIQLEDSSWEGSEVTFNTSSVNLSKSYNLDQPFGELPLKEEENYEFLGWYLSEEPEAEAITVDTIVTDEVKNVYGRYQKIVSRVTFNSNGGTQISDEIDIDAGDRFQNLPIPTRTGYKFDGWYTQNNVKIENNSVVPDEKELILTAHWTPISYSVNFLSNNGNNESTSVNFLYDENKKVLNTFTVPQRYIFVGWSDNPNATTATYTEDDFIYNLTTIDNAELTLYAIWRENIITVDYLKGDSSVSGTMAQSSFEKNTNQTLPPVAYTRTGYNFNGWKDENNNVYPNEGIISATKNYTLTAQWIDNIAPTTPVVTLNKGKLLIKLKASTTENGSGFDHFSYIVNPPSGATASPSSGTFGRNDTVSIDVSTVGNYTVTVTATDKANNTSSVGIQNIDVNGSMTIADAKAVVNASNFTTYIGSEITDYKEDSVIWQIFYFDADNKYGDGANTIYLRRAHDKELTDDYTSHTSFYTSASASIKPAILSDMVKFNPLWSQTVDSSGSAGVIDRDNENVAAYYAYRGNWTQYCVSSKAKYAVGAPGLEMFLDAYNSWVTSVKKVIEYGYKANAKGYYIKEYGGSATYKTAKNVLNAAGNGSFYVGGKAQNSWIGSPNYTDTGKLWRLYASNYQISESTGTNGVRPVVALK